MKKNDKLQKAFEEAEKRKLAEYIDEQNVTRDFSDKHNQKMKKLLEKNKSVEDSVRKAKRKITFGRIAAVAAIMLLCIFVTGAAFKSPFYNGGNVCYDLVIDEAYKTKNKNEGTIKYTGKDIHIKLACNTYDASASYYQEGWMIYVDGIKQTFDVKVKNKKQKNIDMYKFTPDGTGKMEAEFIFQPNTGKKGENLDLQFLVMYSPDKEFSFDCQSVENIEMKTHMVCPMGGYNLVMEKDAPAQTDVCTNFSNTTAGKQHKYIKEVLSDDSGDDLFFAFYKDINKFFSYDEALCYNTQLSTKAEKKDKFIMFLASENDEKYRISLYINNKLQPVFDGCSYADVSVKKGQQTQLVLNIDTTELKEQNEVYILFTQRDVPFGIKNRSMIEQSDIYRLTVE